ncbi:hypothetical protein [Proteus hauseri]|uniref:hypothetical protein n=1 Tax=Proteus hauseri TaxID=183417 RepID=UPI0010097723|nr:hypothetical protein [Proteus hauseri]QAV24362.1 hypothetical protein PH4a_13855 [Proteus hauseri]
MRVFIACIAFIGVIIFGYIVWSTPKLIFIAGLIGSIVAFLTAVANINSSKTSDKNTINQSIGKNSSGIQVGGNLTIGTDKKDKE